MKLNTITARIAVSLEGITREELQAVLQGLRDVEQKDSHRISLMMMVDTPQLTTEECKEILAKIKPFFEYVADFITPTMSKASVVVVNRDIHQEKKP